MTRRTFRFERPDRVVVGTLGRPGARVFHLQVREGSRLVTVQCEKAQISQLALQMDRILDGLAAHAADVLRQFVARCNVIVASGRQYCPYCSQQILSAGGHLCPRSNGYRRPLVW